MLKRHEVEILLKAGHGKTEVAWLKRVAQEGPVMHVDDTAKRAQRQVGRPSRWFVSKVCPGSSVSMILDKSKCSSSMAPASASIFSLRV